MENVRNRIGLDLSQNMKIKNYKLTIKIDFPWSS